MILVAGHVTGLVACHILPHLTDHALAHVTGLAAFPVLDHDGIENGHVTCLVAHLALAYFDHVTDCGLAHVCHVTVLAHFGHVTAVGLLQLLQIALLPGAHF